MKTCELTIKVDYDEKRTDPDSLAQAFDILINDATSTPGLLYDRGDLGIGNAELVPEGQRLLVVHRHEYGASVHSILWQGPPLLEEEFYSDEEPYAGPYDHYATIVKALDINFEPAKDESLEFLHWPEPVVVEELPWDGQAPTPT